jgi:hypothetical protein
MLLRTERVRRSEKVNSPLFEIARVFVSFRSRCPLHRKRESQRDVSGCRPAKTKNNIEARPLEEVARWRVSYLYLFTTHAEKT